MKKYFAVALAVLVGFSACVRLSSGARSRSGPTAMAAIEPLGKGAMKGTFTAREGKNGATQIEMRVEGLKMGMHGTHIHSGGSCGDGGKAAGPHWDPFSTNKHGHPKDPATAHHAADMPGIEVGANGRGVMNFQTTNFKVADLIGKTVVVHENPDNYTDSPANGGSGPRVGCGVIQEKKK